MKLRLTSAFSLAISIFTPQGAAAKGSATFEADYATAPSYRYGELSAEDCTKALGERQIKHIVVDEAPGVLAPVRLPEGLRGITFRTTLSREQGATSPWEVFDCRLVLALHDFAAILERHAIDEVLIYSAWRPPHKDWPSDKLARRHPGALAVDIFRLRKKAAETPCPENSPEKVTHRWLDVKEHFSSAVGDVTCGPEADLPFVESEEATELRAIVCEAAAERIFTTMLTPNYDAAHYNHFHLEITPEVRWRIVR